MVLSLEQLEQIETNAFCAFFALVKNSFPQIYKLLSIIFTTSMSSSEAERCFSALKGIKTFLMGERLTALAILLIESKLVSEINDFTSKVIDRLCPK